jgi:D-alanyl-D-alanine carboxypeptidase
MLNKIFKKVFSIALILLILSVSVFAYNDIATGQSLNITCEGAILVDLDTDTILYKRYMNNTIRPASMTKMMTLLVAYENTLDKHDQLVLLTKEMIDVPAGSSSAYLQAGDKISIHDLFYAMMLPSGNDAAKALAYIVSGNEENFAHLMNDKAKALGMSKSSFKNAHGFDEDGHYTTPYDLSLLAKALCENKKLVEIFSSYKYALTIYPAGDVDSPVKQTVYNTNDMLNPNKSVFMDGFKGIKTGFTKLAGNCLAGYYEKDGRRLVAVVCHSEQGKRDSDMKTLIKYGLNSFDTIDLNTLFASKKVIVDLENAEVSDESNGQLELYLQHPNEKKYITVTKSEGTKIRTFDEDTVAIRYPVLSAPVSAGQNAGAVEFIYDNRVLYSCEALASRTVDAEIASPPNLVSLGIKGKGRISFSFLTSKYFLIPLISVVLLFVLGVSFIYVKRRQAYKVRARQKDGLSRQRRRSSSRPGNRLL